MSFYCLPSLSSIWLSVMGGPPKPPTAVGKTIRTSAPPVRLQQGKMIEFRSADIGRNRCQLGRHESLYDPYPEV